MRTVLDEAETWFFHALVHRAGKLEVVIAEGVKATEPEDVVIGTTNLGPAWRVEMSDRSRWVCVTFTRVCAYQAINESLTSANGFDVFDQGFLRVYERSQYLDFLQSHAIMEHPMAENAQHYCVLTEDQIIDVVAVGEPELEFLQPPTDPAG